LGFLRFYRVRCP